MSAAPTVGIIGGSGALGSAIAKGLLRNGYLIPEQLWISNRSGNAAGFDESPGIHFTSSNQTLVDACDIVIVSVPPHLATSIGIHAESRLIISVMAGVSIEQLQQFSGSDRVVRAISNPAADIGLAYSPWCASAGVTDQDRDWTRSVFGAFGKTDEVPNEDQIDHFTALIGPVPGFVAYFADCMVGYAVKNEIDPKVAERAIRQLFHSSGVVLAESEASPTEHVNAMIDYAGTTAAGLEAMKASPLADFVEQGLKAAYLRAKDIG